MLGNICGYSSPALNFSLLKELEKLLMSLLQKYPLAKIILGGDFNMVWSNICDRYPSRATTSENSFVTECRSLTSGENGIKLTYNLLGQTKILPYNQE